MGFFDLLPKTLGMPTPEEVYQHCNKQQTGSRSLATPITGSVCGMQEEMYSWVYWGAQAMQLGALCLGVVASAYILSQRGNHKEQDEAITTSCRP